MNKEEIVKSFELEFPNRKVTKFGKYKDGYLVVAPDKNMGSDDVSGCIFYINKESISKISPLSDLPGISKALGG